MRSVKLMAVLALSLFVSQIFAAEAPFEQTAFAQLLMAIQNQSQKDFVALGDEKFQTMPEETFTKATSKFSPLLKGGYHSTYLGDFRDTSVRVYYWKLEFPGEPYDWLAKLAVGDGKVKGFFITRP